MLSKKMAFSLTSLITIIRPCIRGDSRDGWRVRRVTLPESKIRQADAATDTLIDVSHADGLQVSLPTGDTTIRVTLNFDRAVSLASFSHGCPWFERRWL